MKLAVTAPRPERYVPALRAAFPNVKIVLAEPGASSIGDADAVLGHLGRAAFLAAPRLRWIQCQGAGVEWLAQIPELATQNVIVTNTRGAHAATIAEHTFGLLIALARGFSPLFAAQQQRHWLRPLPRPAVGLAGLTLGIIGLGQIGRAIAFRAQSFEMPVIALDAAPLERPAYVEALWLPDDLPELLRRADAVVITVPLTPETTGLLGPAQIAMLRPSAYLIAISRGGIVDEDALVAALREGRLAGVALDVQAQEPVPAGSPLWDTPNLLLTPHCAGESRQTTAHELAIIQDNLARFLKGEPLTHVVDVLRGY
jgi:phosphoglycerate dehydrogenase-like enzyme